MLVIAVKHNVFTSSFKDAHMLMKIFQIDRKKLCLCTFILTNFSSHKKHNIFQTLAKPCKLQTRLHEL